MTNERVDGSVDFGTDFVVEAKLVRDVIVNRVAAEVLEGVDLGASWLALVASPPRILSLGQVWPGLHGSMVQHTRKPLQL
jgi:hypothetical protein